MNIQIAEMGQHNFNKYVADIGIINVNKQLTINKCKQVADLGYHKCKQTADKDIHINSWHSYHTCKQTAKNSYHKCKQTAEFTNFTS